MSWEQGRAALEQMIDAKELQRVPASREHADRLLAQSHRHVASACDISNSDPLDPPMGGVLWPFDRMRRQRHEIEYPAMNAEPVLPEDVIDELPKAEAILDLAGRVLEEMSPF